MLEDRFLPPGSDVLHKPKGIWVQGDRLWVTDIDAVWVFDLKTRKGRKLELPGMGFANDPTVKGNDLYISDNRNDLLYRVEPADFLNLKGKPQIGIVFAGKGINPNGLYPARDGSHPDRRLHVRGEAARHLFRRAGTARSRLSRQTSAGSTASTS